MTYAQSEAGPRLTILIPTYDRADYVSHLVKVLDGQARDWADGIEIVVANNQSEDGTQKRLELLAAIVPQLRIILQPVHVATAEENLLSAIPHCRGEYVWSMSDDDEPLPGSLARVMALIDRSETDFFLSNLSISSQNGGLLMEKLAVGQTGVVFQSFAALAEDFGLVTASSCFSASIFKRSVLESAGWQDLVDISPIYSHAFAYVRAFRFSRCEFLHDPLVRYRFEGTPISAWGDVSKKRGQQFYFPWTIGLARLLAKLQREGVIASGFFHRVIELAIGGQFELARSVLQTFCDQLLRWVESGAGRERISPLLFEELALQYVGAEQGTVEVVSRLRQIVALLNSIWPEQGPASLRYGADLADVATMLAPLPRAARQNLEAAWLGSLKRSISQLRASLEPELLTRRTDWGSYAIFQAGGEFIAVLREHEGAARPPQLFRSAASDALRGPSLASVKAALLALARDPVSDRDEDALFDANRFSWPAEWVETMSTFRALPEAPDGIESPQRGSALVGRCFDNALLWSSDLSAAAWEKNRIAVRTTGEALGPAIDVFELIEELVPGDHFLVQTVPFAPGGRATLSWVLKPVSRRYVWVRLLRGSDAVEAVFDLQASRTISSSAMGAAIVGTTCVAVGGGFRRLSVAVAFSVLAGEVTTMLFPLDEEQSASYEGAPRPALLASAPQLSSFHPPVPFSPTGSIPVAPQCERFAFDATPQGRQRALRARFSIPEPNEAIGDLVALLDSADQPVASVALGADGALTLEAGHTRLRIGLFFPDRPCDWTFYVQREGLAISSSDSQVRGVVAFESTNDHLRLVFGGADPQRVIPIEVAHVSACDS